MADPTVLPASLTTPLPTGIEEVSPDEEVFSPNAGQVEEVRFDEEVFPNRDPVTRFGRSANVGIAGAVGGPVDLVNAALGLAGMGSDEPFGGSASIQRGMSALGIAPPPGQPDPETLAGSMGRLTGTAAAMLLGGVGPAARAAGQVFTGARAAPTTVRGAVAQDIGKQALAAPKRVIAGEVTASAAAGAAGHAAREQFPDSEGAVVLAEILGGFTPAGAMMLLKGLPVILGINLLRAVARKLGGKAGKARAETRVQESASDPKASLKELESPEDILPEANLTPAQQTGDEGLLALERSVIESSQQLIRQSDEQIVAATTAIRQSMSDIGEGVSPEKAVEALEQARTYLVSLMETRMRVAALRADERMADLGPNATRQQANEIAREEIEKALSAVRAQERQLWAAVPEDVVLSTKNTQQAFFDALENTPLAQRDDIPDVAKRLLGGADEEVPPGFEDAFAAFGLTPAVGSKLGVETTVAELQGLRSKLLEVARIARAAGNFNKARIASDLADGVLTDLGAQSDEIVGEAGEALRVALDFSANLNEKFTRGPVGRLLGLEKRGGAKTAPELTLETTVGRGGPRAAVEQRALEAAVAEGASVPAVRGATEDFLLNDFSKAAVRDGSINKSSAEAFLRRNEAVFNDFPELKTKIQAAIDADDVASLRLDKLEGLAQRLGDPNVSKAAIFLKEPAEDAMKRVAKSANPEKTMRELVKQAGRDPSGDALKGLKTAFTDFLLNKITSKDVGLISGKRLRNLLDEGATSRMAKQLMSKVELKRLDEIAETAIKIEKAVRAKKLPGDIVEDGPSMIFTLIARIGGARVGSLLSRISPGGNIQTPAFVAEFFKKIAVATAGDPARRLIFDAVKDKQLFAALLRGTREVADREFVRRRLNIWLASVGISALQEDEPDGAEFEAAP